jgi:TRAP-type C4-dicarboxylate transport system permease small subunit
MNRWDRVDELIAKVELILVVFLLSLMILVAFLQILLRNLLATGLPWGDPLVRYLVLWVGFIGAALAVKEGKHITMEVIPRWVSGRRSIYLNAISHLYSTFVCGLLTFAALKFICFEARMGGSPFLALPVWLPELIIPITFGLMTFRYALRLFRECAGSLNLERGPENNHTL